MLNYASNNVEALSEYFFFKSKFLNNREFVCVIIHMTEDNLNRYL